MKQTKSVSTRVVGGWAAGILGMMIFGPLLTLTVLALMILLSLALSTTRWSVIGLAGGVLTMVFLGPLIVAFVWISIASIAILGALFFFLRSERGRLGKLR